MDGNELPKAVNAAFVEPFLEEYERLLGYFSARISRRDEASDLTHEVYLRLIAIPEERVIDSARAYLWAVARSVLCRFLERSGRSVPMDMEDPVLEPLVAVEPECDAHMDRDLHVAQLREHYGSLPPKCRAVMELKWFHELSYEEVAQRSGVSVHMVHKHLKKGLRLLRERMQQLDE